MRLFFCAALLYSSLSFAAVTKPVYCRLNARAPTKVDLVKSTYFSGKYEEVSVFWHDDDQTLMLQITLKEGEPPIQAEGKLMVGLNRGISDSRREFRCALQAKDL